MGGYKGAGKSGSEGYGKKVDINKITVEIGDKGYRVSGSGDKSIDKLVGLYLNINLPLDRIQQIQKQDPNQAKAVLDQMKVKGLQLVIGVIDGKPEATQEYLGAPLAKASEYNELAKNPQIAKKLADTYFKNAKEAAKTLKEAGKSDELLDGISKANSIEDVLKILARAQSKAAPAQSGTEEAAAEA